MPTDHFGEDVAARYDESSTDMFDPAVVDPAVDFLAGLAGQRSEEHTSELQSQR